MSAELFLLLPVDRYRVEYEVGTGAPFSEFEFTVLRAVANEGATNLEQISRVLYLPQRLIIESLVGLARAGWVAIRGDAGGFTVTELGRAALTDPNPPMPERLFTRQGRLLLDRLTGQIASNRDVTYVTTKVLRDGGDFDRYALLPRDWGLPRIDMGQIKSLLVRGKKEWIRWVGEPLLQQEVWLKLHVEGDRIHGLPDIWRAALAARIAQLHGRPSLASSAVSVHAARSRAGKAAASRAWQMEADSARLLLGRAQHTAMLVRALAEAHRQVLIASAFISADVLSRDLAPLIVATTSRGVRVDLMWGYSAGSTEEEQKLTLAALSQLKRQCPGASMFRFNEQPSGSHAKLLAWDDSGGGFHVCAGSFNWLSVRAQTQAGDEPTHEVSVVATNPGLAGDLCTTIASLWVLSDASMTGISDLWQHTAGLLERQAAKEALAVRTEAIDDEEEAEAADEARSTDMAQSGQTPVEIQQVRDQEHETLLRELLLGATRRIAVVSHKVGSKALVRLASLPRLGDRATVGIDIRVLAGEVQSDAEPLMDQLKATLLEAGGRLVMRRGLHAKVVLADDVVVISSYNFLSADPFGKADNAREVGVLIKSSALSDAVWAWINSFE